MPLNLRSTSSPARPRVGRPEDKLQAHVINSIVHRDIQEVCGSSRLLTALVLKFAGARWGAVALLTSYLTLNT